MKAYIQIVSALSRACGVFAILLMASAALVVTEMVFIRYALNGSTVWQTEYVIYSLVAATFLGSPYVLLEKGHVNVDIVPNMMPQPIRLAMNILAGLFGLIFCTMLAWSGWTYFEEAWSYGWTTDTVWALPLWIPLFPLPLGIGILCLQYIAEIAKLRGGVL